MSKIVLVYPGTGSQYSGMFKSLYEDYPIVRETFQEAAEVLKLNLQDLIFEGGLSKLDGVAHAQVAILVCSVAGHRVYMQEVGVKPCLSAGHSLGEWSALTCAGGLSFSDAISAVWRRGKWMEEATPDSGGRIVAVRGLTSQLVKDQCEPYSHMGNWAAIACYNTPDQVVVAGNKAAVEELSHSLEAMGGKVITLTANVPFHTSLMQPAAAQLQEELQSYQFHKLEWPVISNVTALPHDEAPHELAGKLAEQLISPVQWHNTIRMIQRQGVNYAIEIGPNTVLKKLIGNSARNIRAYSLDHLDDVPPIFKLKNVQPSFIDQCLTIAVSTRNSNVNADEYRIGVIEPYKQLLHIQEASSQGDKELSSIQKKQGLELLQRIMTTKKITDEEQEARLEPLMRG